jgi:RNA-binding protein
MDALSNKQLSWLRSEAHHLNPTVQIGRQGLSEHVIGKVAQELAAHELIKLKFLDFKDEKRDICAQIAQDTDSVLVSLVGNVAVFYRQHPEANRRKIALPA